MVSPTFKSGAVIIRRWDDHNGLSEGVERFSTIDEMVSICLQNSADHLVDRIVIEGRDADDRPHTVTLVFQSASAADNRS